MPDNAEKYKSRGVGKAAQNYETMECYFYGSPSDGPFLVSREVVGSEVWRFFFFFPGLFRAVSLEKCDPILLNKRSEEENGLLPSIFLLPLCRPGSPSTLPLALSTQLRSLHLF